MAIEAHSIKFFVTLAPISLVSDISFFIDSNTVGEGQTWRRKSGDLLKHETPSCMTLDQAWGSCMTLDQA